MKGHRIAYSAAELAWLEENRSMILGDYHRAFQAAFGRDDVSIDNLKSLRHRRGWRTGRTGRFEKGSVPANKGKACQPGKGGRHPNSRRTQFKKGNVPHTFRGAGHERIDDEGYVILIVAEVNPWTGAKTRPVFKHRYLWEQANGPIPEGHVLKCLDGNRANTSPSNWEPVPRGLLPRLNGIYGRDYDAAPDEVKPAILTLAKLEQALLDKRRNR